MTKLTKHQAHTQIGAMMYGMDIKWVTGDLVLSNSLHTVIVKNVDCPEGVQWEKTTSEWIGPRVEIISMPTDSQEQIIECSRGIVLDIGGDFYGKKPKEYA